jgi:K+-sensing histidine kinase KdpD
MATEILRVATQRNVTQLIIGKPIHGVWYEWFHGTAVVDKIIRRSEGISIHVIPGKPSGRNLLASSFSPPANVRLIRLLPLVTMIGGVSILQVDRTGFRAGEYSAGLPSTHHDQWFIVGYSVGEHHGDGQHPGI